MRFDFFIDGYLSLPDGTRLVVAGGDRGGGGVGGSGEIGQIDIHPSFRIFLLANRPGFPFLGNDIFSVCGAAFSVHSLVNPELDSELLLAAAVAPDVPAPVLESLVCVFQDLRGLVEGGALTYPYSMRELLNVLRHLQTYPGADVGDTLMNVLAFDRWDTRAMVLIENVLRRNNIPLGRPGVALQTSNALPWFDVLPPWDNAPIVGQHSGAMRWSEGGEAVLGRSGTIDASQNVPMNSPSTFHRIYEPFSERVYSASLPLPGEATVRDAVCLGGKLYALSGPSMYALWILGDPTASGSSPAATGHDVGIVPLPPPRAMRRRPGANLDGAGAAILVNGNPKSFGQPCIVSCAMEPTTAASALVVWGGGNSNALLVVRPPRVGAGTGASANNANVDANADVSDKTSMDVFELGLPESVELPAVLVAVDGAVDAMSTSSSSWVCLVGLTGSVFAVDIVSRKMRSISTGLGAVAAVSTASPGVLRLVSKGGAGADIFIELNIGGKEARLCSGPPVPTAFRSAGTFSTTTAATSGPPGPPDASLLLPRPICFRETSEGIECYLVRDGDAQEDGGGGPAMHCRQSWVSPDGSIVVNFLDRQQQQQQSLPQPQHTEEGDTTTCLEIIDMQAGTVRTSAYAPPTALPPSTVCVNEDGYVMFVHGNGDVQIWEVGTASLERSLHAYLQRRGLRLPPGMDLNAMKQAWEKVEQDRHVDVAERRAEVERMKDREASGTPKHGKEDDKNEPHVGGNTWAGGSGGSDTAGLGGKGGPYRLDKGHDVHQLSDEAKNNISEEAKRAALEAGKAAYKKKLDEIDMAEHEFES